jgi:hypothetical protein
LIGDFETDACASCGKAEEIHAAEGENIDVDEDGNVSGYFCLV